MKILQVDYTHPHASADFTRSLQETGFGVLSKHPLDMALVDQVFRDWKTFFDLPAVEKRKFLYHNDTQDGLFPADISETAKGETLADIKEFFHFYPWGQCPDFLRAQTLELRDQMTILAQTLLTWIENNTPEAVRNQFSMPLPRMLEGTKKTLLRILHYPPLTGHEECGAVRAAAHEDINLITLLPAATAPGLQVKDRLGNWHDVPCDPGSVVVNIGDMLQMCSNGYYPSTTHRVSNPTGAAAKESRLSMPLFLHAEDSVQLSKTHTAHTYWMERLRELGIYTEPATETA